MLLVTVEPKGNLGANRNLRMIRSTYGQHIIHIKEKFAALREMYVVLCRFGQFFEAGETVPRFACEEC